MKRAALLLCVSALAACATPTPSADVDAGTLPDGASANPDTGHTITTPVTYYGDVRPILAAHCVGCHQDGAIGSPYDTYETASGAAGLIETYTAERRMPPYLADNSGACNHFQTDEWLTDTELATLSAWNAQGTPEGDPSTPAPMIRDVPHLTGADVQTVDTGVDYAPNRTLNDDYRCFLVQAPAGNGYVTAAEVHPGNPLMVHHVIVYEPQTQAAVDEVMARDAAEAGPGYTCFGGAGSDEATPLVLWAPGTGAVETPRGTGLPIDGTRPLIVQVHYNLLAAPEGATDRTTVGIRIASSAIPGYFLPVVDGSLNIQPHTQSAVESAEFPFGSYWLGSRGVSSAHVYTVGPHMHTLGTDIRVEIVGDTADTCLVHVPRWDFGWQRGYVFDHPVAVDDTTMMRITCTYDSSDRDDVVHWGEGTQDEMCIAFLYTSI